MTGAWGDEADHERAASRVDYLEVATRRVVGTIELGKYPFHSPKRGRDGNYVPATASEMWFSDHGRKVVHVVSAVMRRVIASVPGGAAYHVTLTPGGAVFVANHRSNSVTNCRRVRCAVRGTLKVAPEPNGEAVLVHAPSQLTR